MGKSLADNKILHSSAVHNVIKKILPEDLWSFPEDDRNDSHSSVSDQKGNKAEELTTSWCQEYPPRRSAFRQEKENNNPKK